MIVETIPVLADNYAYLVVCEQTRQAAVVDPADAGPVLERVAARQVKLAAIWNTHHHWDHTAGNQDLLERHAGLEVCGHREDAPRIPGITRALEHEQTFQLGRLTVKAIHAPGHTAGGLVYWVEDAAFSGDVLFGAGCGRLFEGDATTLYRSVVERLAVLAPETRIYCGHEYTEKNLRFAATVDQDNPLLRERIDRVTDLRRRDLPSVPSSWAEELQTNPFLRCDSAALRCELRRRFTRDPIERPEQVFALLRRLRDRF